MGYVDAGLHQAKSITAKVFDHRKQEAPTHSQSVTIGCSVDEVKAFFTDPDRLSVAFGDIAEVHPNEGGLRWQPVGDDAGRTTWETTVIVDERRVRFVSADDGGAEMVLDFASAPRDQGTEVLLRQKGPIPGLVAGALTFKVLYRARALLQAGEVPTLKHNPSARASDR